MKPVFDEVIEDFGREWSRFSHSGLDVKELQSSFSQYFEIFPFDTLHKNSVGFDLGCGSGRWANFIAKRVGCLICVDPSSEALKVAKANLAHHSNVVFKNEAVENLSIADLSMDFGYSLGVLHHTRDTARGIRECTAKLKPGAPFLLYLYYSLDNRPLLFRALWKLSDLIRKIICRLPPRLKFFVCELIALFVYLPMARIAKVFEMLGLSVENFPLSDYRAKSFYIMRTDALDRFGTKVEKRFTKSQIGEMLRSAGMERIQFSNKMPFWVSLSYKS